MINQLKKATCLTALSLAILATTSTGSFAAGRAAAFAYDGTPTGILQLPLVGLTLNGQITFPTVFVYPAENQEWFSTLRICYNPLSVAGLSLFPLIAPAVANVTLDIYASPQDSPLGNGVLIRSLPNQLVPQNGCIEYTSDVPGDALFGGLPSGTYSVVATNNAFLGLNLALPIAVNLGYMSGTVNSTGRNVMKKLMDTPAKKG